MKKVSIIIPTYNNGSYIKECLESVLSQTYSNIEVIIIDDGSTDNTKEFCKKYINNKKVIYKKQKNKGVSAARNRGIEIATGYYIAFIDSDDIVSNNYIETLVKNIEVTKSDLSTSLQSKDGHFQEGSYSIELGTRIIDEILGETGGFSPMKLYKKEIIKSNNIKFNENIKACEDLLFNMQYAEKVSQACIGNQKHYYYRKHSESTMNNLQNKDWFDILKVYTEVLDNYCKNDVTSNRVRYILLLLICEARYRKKYAETIITDQELKTLYRNNIKELDSLTLSQRLKLLAYKYATGLIIKRRMIK